MTDLGLTEKPSAMKPTGMIAFVMDALKDPSKAALLGVAYLVWHMTTQLDGAQANTLKQAQANGMALVAIEQQHAEEAEGRKINTALLRMICIGVNKGQAQKDCGK